MNRTYILALLLATIACQTLRVSISNTTINAIATYTATVNRSSLTLTNISNYQITFGFPSTNYSGSLSNISCTPTCTVNGTNVTIAGSSFSNSSNLVINISGVVNPSSTQALDGYTYWMLLNGSKVESVQYFYGALSPGLFKGNYAS